MKSPYNALRFVLARHICSFNYQSSRNGSPLDVCSRCQNKVKNNMADSSEKVSFLVDMQCSALRAEAFLVFDKGSQPTLGQQITDMRPTVG